MKIQTFGSSRQVSLRRMLGEGKDTLFLKADGGVEVRLEDFFGDLEECRRVEGGFWSALELVWEDLPHLGRLWLVGAAFLGGMLYQMDWGVRLAYFSLVALLYCCLASLLAWWRGKFWRKRRKAVRGDPRFAELLRLRADIAKFDTVATQWYLLVIPPGVSTEVHAQRVVVGCSLEAAANALRERIEKAAFDLRCLPLGTMDEVQAHASTVQQLARRVAELNGTAPPQDISGALSEPERAAGRLQLVEPSRREERS